MVRRASCSLTTVLLASLLLVAGPSPLRAAWVADGTPICTAVQVQDYSAVVPSGDGGVFIVWRDVRNYPYMEQYAQKLDLDGSRRWEVDGRRIGPERFFWRSPSFIADGEGGILAMYILVRDEDYLDTDVYVQKVDAEGARQWPDSGMAVCRVAPTQNNPVFVTDGAGGCIVAWSDRRTGNTDIYAQRIDRSGNRLWGDNGVPVSTAPESQLTARLAADGAGGAYLSWCDLRDSDHHVYLQHLDASGNAQWTADGQPLTSTPSALLRWPWLTADGAGGVFVLWTTQDADSMRVYAQRVGASGTGSWAGDGVRVLATAGRSPQVWGLGDGAGGVIVSIEIPSATAGYSDVTAQRFDAAGSRLWGALGVPVARGLAIRGQSTFCVRDDTGGYYVFWQDRRHGTGNEDIYGQRVEAAGTLDWEPSGKPLCTAPSWQAGISALADGRGGAIVSWTDNRSYDPTKYDIYALGVRGTVPVCFDIRPGSDSNPLNPQSKGVLPAAIVGSERLAVATIDPRSIRLAGVAPLRCSLEDVAAPAPSVPACGGAAPYTDGIDDLVLKFSTQELLAAVGSAPAGAGVPLLVTGLLTDGTAFEGVDCVQLHGVGPHGGHEPRDGRLITLASRPADRLQRVHYTMAQESAVAVQVMDVKGQVVARLENAVRPAGIHALDWDTAGLPSGVYLCRVATAAGVATKKIVLLR